MEEESTLTVTAASDREVTFYIPYELYGTTLIVEESETPALYYFTMEPDKFYRIKNLSETNSYYLYNNSDGEIRYDYSRVDENGEYTYKGGCYGRLYLPKNSNTDINLDCELPMLIWMPYDFHNKIIVIEEKESSSIYKFTLEPGKNYQFSNKTDNNIGIKNNSSKYDERTYDYIKYNSNSRITTRRDTCGAIPIDKNRKTLVAITGNNPIECYVPYELYTSGIEYHEMDGDITSIYDVVPKVNVKINLTLAKKEDDNSNYTVEDSLDKYYYDIYNITKGKRIYDIDVQGNTILILDKDTSSGDELKITLSSRADQTNSLEKSTIIDENLNAQINFNVLERGYFKADYDEVTLDNRPVVAIVFDENDSYIKTFSPYTNNTIISDPLPSGTYKIVFLKQSGFIWRLNNFSEYETCGFVEGSDYIVKTVNIVDGVIKDLGNVLIPSFNENKLSYFEKEETFLTTNVDKIVVGGLIEYRMQYKFKEQYVNEKLRDITLKVDLPEGAILVDNSVILNGKLIDYEERKETLSVKTDEAEGVLKYYVKPFDSSQFETKAKISFYYNRRIEEVVGIVNVDVPYLTIEGNASTSTEKITVKGVTNNGKDITIFDGENIVGSTIANNKGQWTSEIELFAPYDGSIHQIYATTFDDSLVERTSNVLEVKYGKNQPEVQEFIMYHKKQKVDILESYSKNVRPHCTFYPSRVFSFSIKIDNPESIKDVYVTSTRNNEQKRIKAVYDKKSGCWVASGYFNPNNKNYVPGTIGLDYSIVETEPIFDADNPLTEDELRHKLPPEWRDSTIEIKESTENELIASILLNEEGAKPFDVIVTEENDVEILTESQYTEQGYTPVRKSDGALSYIKYGFDGETVHCIIVDIGKEVTKSTVKSIVIKGLDKKELSYVDSGYSIAKDVIKFGGRCIDISSARKTIMNANISSAEKEVLLGELDDLKVAVEVMTLMSLTFTVVGMTCELPFAASFLLSSMNIVIGPCFDRYYDEKMEALKSLIPGFSFVWRIDPSGYVYEVIPENRLEGVTVKAFTQSDTGDSVLWDAEEFDQENPLTTDSEGRYAWDVPEGMWQVVANLEGYEEARSEWLPVPPPQTEVNINMVSLEKPDVDQVNIYGDQGEICFNKYVQIDKLDKNSINVVDENGISIYDDIEPTEIIESENGIKLAKKFMVKWKEDSVITQGSLYAVTILEGVESYAGIKTDNTITKNSIAAIKSENIVFDPSNTLGFGKTKEIPIIVEPANSTNGLKLSCISSMSDIVEVNNISDFDSSGTANITITSKLPGNAELDFEVLGTDLKGNIEVEVILNVEEPKGSLVGFYIKHLDGYIYYDIYTFLNSKNDCKLKINEAGLENVIFVHQSGKWNTLYGIINNEEWKAAGTIPAVHN